MANNLKTFLASLDNIKHTIEAIENNEQLHDVDSIPDEIASQIKMIQMHLDNLNKQASASTTETLEMVEKNVEHIEEPIENFNENDVRNINTSQPQEKMESLPFKIQNEELVPNEQHNGALYETVHDNAMEDASSDGAITMQTMATKVLDINQEVQESLENINENYLSSVQFPDEKMESFPFQNQTMLVGNVSDTSAYVTVCNETMDDASSDSEHINEPIETNNENDVPSVNTSQPQEKMESITFQNQNGEFVPNNPLEYDASLYVTVCEETIGEASNRAIANGAIAVQPITTHALQINEENSNDFEHIHINGERANESASSSREQFSSSSSEEQTEDPLANNNENDLSLVRTEENMESFTIQSRKLILSPLIPIEHNDTNAPTFATVFDETMRDAPSKGALNTTAYEDYMIPMTTGNFARRLVMEAIGSLANENDELQRGSNVDIQTADSTTSSEMQMDIQAEVVVATTPDQNEVESLGRPKRARKINPRYGNLLKQTSGTNSSHKNKKSANTIPRMQLPEKPAVQPTAKSANSKFETAMRKRQSTIRKTVSFAEPLEKDAIMPLYENPTTSKLEIAMKKRQSAIRQTVSGTRPKIKKDVQNEDDGNGSTNAFARNTNKQMHPKNTLYQTLCVFCNQNYQVRLVSHYVTTHPQFEVPIARLSPSMAERLRAQTHDFKRANGKTVGLCYFCEEDKGCTTNGWENHLATHTGERHLMFICRTCDAEVNTKASHNGPCNGVPIKIYCENSTDGSATGFMCNECNYVQINRDRMVKHLKDQHDVKNPAEKRHFRKLVLVPAIGSFK